MEIYTQNLFTVTISHQRIQSNFLNIDQALKLIHEKLSSLSSTQLQLSRQVSANSQIINTLQSTVKNQTAILSKHRDILQQFETDNENFQDVFSSAKSVSDKQSIRNSEHPQMSFEEESEKKTFTKINREESQRKIKENVEEKVTKINLEENKSKGLKTGFDKMFSSLKERIFNLERDSEEKERLILDLKKIVEKFKFKEQQHHTSKKLPVELIKKSNSKKNIFEDKGRPSLYDLQERQLSSKSIISPSEQPEPSDLNSTPNINSITNDSELTKDLISLKDALLQKIRVIEIQFKENQTRVQAVEKTVDILERSHEMLKYDFDRTSTGWSKNRTAETHDKSRSPVNLSETRMNTSIRDFYEQKIVELFNELDSLKKQYIQLHTKLYKEEQTSDSGLRSPSELKDKSNIKTIHSLKVEGGQQKKQMALFKRQLSKLREDFDEFVWGNASAANEVKTVVIKPNENKQDWKILSTKIYKLRMELQAGLRDLEGKIATNNDMVVVLNGLEVGIEECRLLMKRKVQYGDYEKGLKRLEGRLNNFIMQVYEKEGKENEADAALAKQPWFCLSCDSEVKNHSLRPNKSPVKQKLVGRKVNPESHMVRRNENGRLPSVLK